MKIGFITEKYPPEIGGLAVSSERLVKLLIDAGHQIRVLTFTSHVETRQALFDAQGQLTICRLGAYRRMNDTLQACFDILVRQHQKINLDLLHGYFITQAGFISTYAGKFMGIPTVVSARGNDLDRAIFDPAKAAHILYALNYASAVTGNSYELVNKAQALAPNQKVFYVPNGVDTDIFQPRTRNETLANKLGLNEHLVVGFVGEARAKKGLAHLLLAFRELSSRFPVALLLVGGVRSGEDKDLLKVFRKQHPGLHIVLTPYISNAELPDYYSLIDIMVLPSLHDGLPNALLEAMACERAVVATPVGGFVDAIVNGKNGRLIPPDDVNSLVIALAELLSNREMRQQLGRQARITVSQKFTLTAELEGYLKVYDYVQRGINNKS